MPAGRAGTEVTSTMNPAVSELRGSSVSWRLLALRLSLRRLASTLSGRQGQGDQPDRQQGPVLASRAISEWLRSKVNGPRCALHARRMELIWQDILA
jgi:hypothetical protein